MLLMDQQLVYFVDSLINSRPLNCLDFIKMSSSYLWAGRDQMHKLAANLISNAVKYNKQNGWVKINLTDMPTKLKLKVSDTGIGIPSESQGRIFERFYRVDKGRSRRIGGTGLGLSIVKHIVNAYGGEITLKSIENEGTSISVILPKKKPQGSA